MEIYINKFHFFSLKKKLYSIIINVINLNTKYLHYVNNAKMGKFRR